ncbi:MAG: disulfide bond formation protein B [Acidobacteria bacterium]|nr:disulfide bond formation protein B [Acidobacteriota bacterium]
MNTETMQLLSALLALFAAGGTLVLLVARLSAGRSPSAANFVLAFRPVALPLAFMVAGFAMFASLWFSEAANYNPCKLCWYQRIAMYSLAIVSGVALVKRWRAARRSATGDDVFASQREITPYAIVLAALGSVVSTYHFLLEWNPTWESNVCSLDVPCTTIWFREFGFVTLPFMALCGYVSIIILLSTTYRSRHEH